MPTCTKIGHLVVYKGAHVYEDWTSGGLDQCKYARTRSGWMEDEVFQDWLKSTFVPFVSDKRKPVILFYDGHGSRLTYC